MKLSGSELALAGVGVRFGKFDFPIGNSVYKFAEAGKDKSLSASKKKSTSGGSSNKNSNSRNNKNEIKNVYNSIKEAPKYPSGFKLAKNGNRKVNVKNKDVLEKLREIESGQWKKVYKDGYDSKGNKISVHYFESQSGKVFDVKVKSGWSNK